MGKTFSYSFLTIGCIQNTRTGDASSCTDDTCVCKEGFAPPDCCECDLSGLSGRPHYKDPVTGECKRELTIPCTM